MQQEEYCPICGKKIENVDLVETRGWFECEKCKNQMQLCKYAQFVKLPVYTPEQAAKMFAKPVKIE